MDDAQAQKMNAMANMILMIAALFVILGIILHVTAWIKDFTVFQPLLEEYWTVDKATRDAAKSGSDLANKLSQIQQFPPKLMLFKLVGIGSILVGIWLALFVIARRMGMLPMRLASILKR
jgi:hypothetical protein